MNSLNRFQYNNYDIVHNRTQDVCNNLHNSGNICGIINAARDGCTKVNIIDKLNKILQYIIVI